MVDPLDSRRYDVVGCRQFKQRPEDGSSVRDDGPQMPWRPAFWRPQMLHDVRIDGHRDVTIVEQFMGHRIVAATKSPASSSMSSSSSSTGMPSPGENDTTDRAFGCHMTLPHCPSPFCSSPVRPPVTPASIPAFKMALNSSFLSAITAATHHLTPSGGSFGQVTGVVKGHNEIAKDSPAATSTSTNDVDVVHDDDDDDDEVNFIRRRHGNLSSDDDEQQLSRSSTPISNDVTCCGDIRQLPTTTFTTDRRHVIEFNGGASHSANAPVDVSSVIDASTSGLPQERQRASMTSSANLKFSIDAILSPNFSSNSTTSSSGKRFNITDVVNKTAIVFQKEREV